MGLDQLKRFILLLNYIFTYSIYIYFVCVVLHVCNECLTPVYRGRQLSDLSCFVREAFTTSGKVWRS